MTARRRISLVSVLTLAGALLVAPVAPASAAPSAAATECTKQVSALRWAEPLDGDLAPNGAPVAESTLRDGSSIPVVMVHGWTGQSVHDGSRDGNFSKMVDLTYNKGQAVNLGRSLIGVIQDAGGATVYTFDYHDTSSRWVTDDTIGRQLANALSCLAAAHGHPAMVVAHSMGGLATRQALSLIAKDGTHGAVEANVSDVITYGTPNSGSWLASVIGAGDTAGKYAAAFPGASGAAVTAIRSLVTLCGTASTRSMTNAGLCTSIIPQLGSATSDAARALATGSDEMKALPKWPGLVRVQSMAGSAEVDVLQLSWFGTTVAAGSVNLGDFVVGEDSARGGARLTQSANCGFVLDWRSAVSDNILSAAKVGVKSAGETKDWVLTGGTSPCFHGNLMRNQEFANTVLATIAELVDEQNALLAPPRLVIDSTGIGPVKIGGREQVETLVGAEHTMCLGSGPWGLTASGSDDIEGVMVLGNPAEDAPATSDGITLGSHDSELAAIGAAPRVWEMEPTYRIWTWTEDGVLMSAFVTPEGTVQGIGVGTDVFYPDYC